MACAVKEHITPLLKLPNRIKLKSEMNLMEKVLTKQQWDPPTADTPAQLQRH